MACKRLFFLLFLAQEALVAQTGEKIPSGIGAYDTLVHLAAIGSSVENEDYLGVRSRDYYDSLIEEASQRRWAFPFAFNYTLESRYFDCKGCKKSIGCALFGEHTALRDIYVLARVSEQDKMYLQLGYPRGPTRPLSSRIRPKFGQFTNEQYLSLIAPAKIGLSARRHALDLNFSGMYRFQPFCDRRFFTILGFNLPVRFEVRMLDMLSYDGSLHTHGFSPNDTIRENTLIQFMKDFTSVQDFFIRAVLGSKGIVFCPSQERVGIGDISLFGILEIGPFFGEFSNGFCYSLDSAQFGLNIAFPSASKCSQNHLWEIQFGNGGGFLFTAFHSAHFRTELNPFNPFYHVGFEFSPKFCISKAKGTGVRIPRVVTHTGTEQLIYDPNVTLPVINGEVLFGEYRADDFVELDSTVSLFADSIPCATVKAGRRLFFGIGNYFYDLFKTGFRAGIFYTYSTKNPDCFYCLDSSYDTSSLSFKTKSHRIGWNLTYQSQQAVEVGFGSQHIFSGCNVPEQHEIFASLVVSF